MRPALFLTLGLVAAGCVGAQQPTLNGPVEAYTFDAPTRSLHAVIGFPGAASFGPALRDSLEFASVAPRQSYAIGFEDGECLLISGLGSSLLSTRALAGVKAQPEGIAWSGDGSLAILYSRSGNWLQTVSGFPGAPVAEARLDGSTLGGGLGGVLASVAADAQGKQIAAAVTAGAGGEAGAVYYSSDGQTYTSLQAVAQPIALSFSSDGLTLYALDGSVPQVIAITLADRAYHTIPLAGLKNPIAIQAVVDSENHQLLYVAAGSDRLLRVIDLATQQIVTDVQVSFQPSGLNPFGGNSFVVAARSQAANPLWLFTSTPQPAAYFVPAIHLAYPDHRLAESVGGVR
jgi:hypothetical protein